MINSLTIYAPAKLNLSLDIVGVRDDGYHLMEMIMQTIDLYDIITVTQTMSGKIIITGNFNGVNFDETNIAYKAATAFFSYTKAEYSGIEIAIEKYIPVGAGLGGGSADGAAVIRALDTMFCTNLSLQDMTIIGVKVGADIPYCLVGGTALVTGIGERVFSIARMPDCCILLCKPKVSVVTAEAFKDYDSAIIRTRPDIVVLQTAIKNENINGIAEVMGNVFEDVIKYDEIEYVKDEMRRYGGLKPMITGSGSAVFSIFSDEKKANECREWLIKAKLQAFVCRCV